MAPVLFGLIDVETRQYVQECEGFFMLWRGWALGSVLASPM